MNIEREVKVRDAIKYCIENFDSQTATNRIVEFWKDELKLQEQQCDIANVSGIIAEIDSLKKFNVESVDSDGKRVIEYDKDGMFIDANELDRKILSYR
tara:strand:+ start:976 stop:1269 length:294 start_codon:yes stop_codon:yes gene_type:complete